MKKELVLKGKTLVLVDWANVWGWRHQKGCDTSPEEIKKFLDLYTEIKERRFYFGEDSHPKSAEFLKQVTKIGYRLVAKPVKYQNGLRKCNFDIEMAVDSLASLKKYNTYVFFSGDGDFAYLYKELVKFKKRVIVVFGKNSLGRELHDLDGVFLMDFRKFGKKYPPEQVRGPRLSLLSNKKVKKSSKVKNGRK